MEDDQNITLVKPTEFLNGICGKEIKLDTQYKDKHIYLLIYPREKIQVGEIKIGSMKCCCIYNSGTPYSHNLGAIKDNRIFTIVSSKDDLYDLILNALQYNGIISEYYEYDTIDFDEDCFKGIKNTYAVVSNVSADKYDVEILGTKRK